MRLFRGLVSLLLLLTFAPMPSFAASPYDPGIDAQKFHDELKNQPFDVKTIFTGPTFPTIDFRDKQSMRSRIEPYTIRARFFDAKWKEVTAPTEIGRYGALIQVQAGGVSIEREVTFYHAKGPIEPQNLVAQLPPECGISGQVIAQEQWSIKEVAEYHVDLNDGEPGLETRLLAAMHDIQDNPALGGYLVDVIESNWWSELDRRLGVNRDYDYLLNRPEDYDKDPKSRWPLMLFLHGSGERGGDLKELKDMGPRGYINTGHALPVILVTPLCPNDRYWNSVDLMRLIDKVSAENRVDPKRIYITGLSMGGLGAFDLAATYPDKIAAFASLSGGAPPNLASRLKTVPAWIFHGTSDKVVPVRYSTDIAAAMEKLGEPVKLTTFPGGGHGHWDVTYANPDLYTWFLQQTR